MVLASRGLREPEERGPLQRLGDAERRASRAQAVGVLARAALAGLCAAALSAAVAALLR